jgi:uncharacterized protein YbjT (DUF2867 family)
VVALGRLATRLGARSFTVVSSIGADPGARPFYLRTKGEAEAALAELDLRRLVILQPSLLTGERATPRPGERLAEVVLGLVSPLLIGPLRRYRPVPAAAVARAMLRASRESPPGTRILRSDEVARLGALNTSSSGPP